MGDDLTLEGAAKWAYAFRRAPQLCKLPLGTTLSFAFDRDLAACDR